MFHCWIAGLHLVGPGYRLGEFREERMGNTEANGRNGLTFLTTYNSQQSSFSEGLVQIFSAHVSSVRII